MVEFIIGFNMEEMTEVIIGEMIEVIIKETMDIIEKRKEI